MYVERQISKLREGTGNRKRTKESTDKHSSQQSGNKTEDYMIRAGQPPLKSNTEKGEKKLSIVNRAQV